MISLDDAKFGPGSITQDSASGLQWLDVLHTMSPAELNGSALPRSVVEAGFAAGGAFEGFRYATAAEFQALLTNAGITFTLGCCGTDTPSNIVPIQALQLLVGVTQLDRTGTKGFLADGLKGEIWAGNGRAFVFQNDQDDAGGSWLVRSVPASVPEPTSLVLLGLALAGARLRRRRRHT